MPQVLPALAAFAVKVATSKLLIYAIIRTVLINLALGALSKALAGKKKFTGNTGQSVLIRGTTEARRIIYGETVTSGVLVDAELTGTDNKHLWYLVALAGHQCEAIGDVMLDGVTILSANINASTGEVTQAPYTGKLWIWKRLGTNAQTVLTELDSVSGAWTATAHLKGITYIAVKLERDTEVWKSGAPGNFRAKVKGKRVYDPRKDSTNGGSGTHRLADATTWEWSDNEPLCRADFMTGGSIWFDVATPLVIYGPKIPTDEINWTVLAASANKADEDVTIPPASPTTTQKRYTVNVVLSCADHHEENRQKIEACSLGQTVPAGDGWRILVGGFETPAITFTDADLVDSEDIEWIGGDGLKDRKNRVDAVFFDPNRDWQENTCPVQTDSAYETEDGKILPHTIRLEGVTDSYRAQRLCRLHLRHSRNQQGIQLPFMLNGLKCSPWETAYLTLTEQSWTNKTVRSHEVRIGLDTAQVVHLFKEDSAASWTDPAIGDYTTPTTSTTTNQQGGPSAPSGLTAIRVPDGIEFSFTAGIFMPVGGVHELLENTTDSYGSATVIWRGLSTSLRIPKSDTTVRYYWVRAAYLGVSSDPDPATNGVPAAALSVTTGFRATCSPSSVGKTQDAATIDTPSPTVTPINGVSPYTHAWTKLSGDADWSIINGTTATPTFRRTNCVLGNTYNAQFRDTVTDSTGGTPLTTTVDCNAYVTREDPLL